MTLKDYKKAKEEALHQKIEDMKSRGWLPPYRDYNIESLTIEELLRLETELTKLEEKYLMEEELLKELINCFTDEGEERKRVKEILKRWKVIQL